MVYNSIIGRTEEIKNLKKFFKSSKSEFVAIYGRRRVGKSYVKAANEVLQELYRQGYH